MEWLGQAKIEFTHAASPMAIKEKDGTNTDLLQICEKNTPPCNLNPWLFNGHLQTFWTATKPHGPKVFYRRRVFEAEEKAFRGSFTVDFAVEPHEENDKSLPWRTVHYTDDELKNMGSDDSKPMLVVLHGLSGGSHEVYLRSTIAPLLGEGGWEVCVVNSRGCAKSKLTSGILYNARTTWDVRQVSCAAWDREVRRLINPQTVKWLRKTYPNRPLFALGFSLGANILTNASCPKLPIFFATDTDRFSSTVAKRAPTVCSRAPSSARTRITWKPRARFCGVVCSARRYISAQWAVGGAPFFATPLRLTDW